MNTNQYYIDKHMIICKVQTNDVNMLAATHNTNHLPTQDFIIYLSSAKVFLFWTNIYIYI